MELSNLIFEFFEKYNEVFVLHPIRISIFKRYDEKIQNVISFMYYNYI